MAREVYENPLFLAMSDKARGRVLTADQEALIAKAKETKDKKWLIKSRDRAARLVQLEWEGKTSAQIAEELGLRPSGLSAFKTKCRDLIALEWEIWEKTLEQERSMTRLRVKDQIHKKAEAALSAVDSCLTAKSEAVRERAAFKVLDRIDPIKKGDTSAPVGVFSNKTAGLLQAALPIEAEVELIDSKEEALQGEPINDEAG